MANVNLSIAGRTYTIACDAGEEAHITQLGRSIDAKLAAMPGISGQSESRALLFAALLLADALHHATNPAPEPRLATLADRLDGIVDRIAPAQEA